MRFLAGLRAFFGMRCPRCYKGPIYAAPFELHKACPECGLVYEREPGYFVGALYAGYLFGIVILGLLTCIGSTLFPSVDLGLMVLISVVVFVPFVPMTTRYARVLWMYVDRMIWPDKPV